MIDAIEIIGARTHNLKNISLRIPRNRLVVVTGVSGSGKSSLVFDTLYAEGQRRYVESLSVYVRQFMERMDRPDVDKVHGISPAVAIEQKNPSKGSRSTVGTATEVHDYLRLLFARIGRTYCPSCVKQIRKDQVQDIVTELLQLPTGTKIMLSFPFPLQEEASISFLKKKGFYRLIIGKTIQSFGEIDKLPPQADILVDRIEIKEDVASRLADSLQLCFEHGRGHVTIHLPDGSVKKFSQGFECADCGIIFQEPQPGLFSFNHPTGACPSCKGFGDIITIDEDLVIPDKKRSIVENCIAPWNTPTHRELVELLMTIGPKHGIDIYAPYEKLSDEAKHLIWHGVDEYPGILGFFEFLESKKYKIGIRVFLSRYRGYLTCPSCKGSRLRPEALYVRLGDKNIAEISRMTIAEAVEFFRRLTLSDFESRLAGQILTELRKRLDYLMSIGLGYLTLDRRSNTLSGGEYQRINLATALGAQLVGSMYILDEPTIGLHPHDNQKLINTLKALRNLGNTVLVVEHDRDMMRQADHIIDLGPRAGKEGGEVIFEGDFESIRSHGRSLTGAYLRGNKMIPLPDKRRVPDGRYLEIIQASEHNLKNISVKIPLGMLVVVTGVSGSGKSTLVHDVLYAGLMKKRGVWRKRVGRFAEIRGDENIEDVILVDQTPIGRTPRSNPATYVKAFDPIRQVFSETQRARLHNLKAGAFSFNVPGGRCETCQGAGVVKVEMQFLADLLLECETCGGKRYRREILDIRYRGKNIAEVLDMTVQEAIDFFKAEKAVTKRLALLKEVGLGYIKLGQPATTLSGGEAQRVKLAAHLGDNERRKTLFIFDEPTTGLHFDDVATLLHCFNSLIQAGHSLLVIEHNIDVIKCADYIIDLGPGGGEEGGYVVAEGTPEKISQEKNSLTGKYLLPYLS